MDAVLAGEASTEERQTLERLSAADPGIQKTIESRAALFSALRQVRVVDPPPGLRSEILEAVRQASAANAKELAESPSGHWARMFHPKRWRSQMAYKQWILGGAVVLAAVVAFVALRNPGPKTNAQGTIGAANRYNSEQVGSGDVSLDKPEIAAFIQSDTFRKLAASPSFREAAKSDAFNRVVSNDALREASAKHDLARVFENAHVVELLKSDAFAKGMTDALVHESLLKADLGYLMESAHLADLLKMDALKDAALRTDFIKVANEAARLESVKIADFSRLADNYATLKDSDAIRALEGNKYFIDALQHGFLDLFRTPESAKFATEGLRSLTESAHLAEALKVDGFRSVMEGLNVDTFGAVREVASSATVDLFRDAAFREAAARTEFSQIADAGFVDALARIPE